MLYFGLASNAEQRTTVKLLEKTVVVRCWVLRVRRKITNYCECDLSLSRTWIREYLVTIYVAASGNGLLRSTHDMLESESSVLRWEAGDSDT